MQFTGHSLTDFAWICVSMFLMGMNKGGFPVGSIALPLLILAWPQQTDAARSAVAFMLPVLCVMDLFAIAFYRRHILWARLKPLIPGTIFGVALATVLFVSDSTAFIAVSDRALKICIGVLGLSFVGYRAARKWILRRLENAQAPSLARSSAFGLGAGVTSTLAHAAGPVMQMYLLPQKLPKMNFAGTTAAYFFMLNLIKVPSFAALGRFNADGLLLGACVLPVIPLGVAAGYALVRVIRGDAYVGFIYAVLFVTSALLIVKALGA